MFTRMFQIVLFFSINDVLDFLKFLLKLFFFYHLFFFKILGASFHLEALGNGLIGLVEGRTLPSIAS